MGFLSSSSQSVIVNTSSNCDTSHWGSILPAVFGSHVPSPLSCPLSRSTSAVTYRLNGPSFAFLMNSFTSSPISENLSKLFPNFFVDSISLSSLNSVIESMHSAVYSSLCSRKYAYASFTSFMLLASTMSHPHPLMESIPPSMLMMNAWPSVAHSVVFPDPLFDRHSMFT